VYNTNHKSLVGGVERCRSSSRRGKMARCCCSADLVSSDGVKVLKILLGLAGFAWRAIISSMVTSFLLFAILLEVIATTIEALDIGRNRSFLSSAQRS
jgi:hypothetical protein